MNRYSLALAGILIACTVITGLLGDNATFDALPGLAQVCVIFAAVITGAGWTAAIIGGIVYLIVKAVQR
jgi:hypothetical protein